MTAESNGGSESTTLVLGVGNTLLTDEGVGVHVIHYLSRAHPPPPGVRYLDGGTLSFTLAVPIEEADQLIVVDAAELDAPPGTVRTYIGPEMDRYLGAPRRSVHEVGLCDLMDIARLTDRLPSHRALVGIQPAEMGWGDQPSPSVAEVIPNAAASVLDLIAKWSDLKAK